MTGTFEDDLRKELEDPEFAAYFANALAESAKELLDCGATNSLTTTSGSNKTKHITWRVRND